MLRFINNTYSENPQKTAHLTSNFLNEANSKAYRHQDTFHIDHGMVTDISEIADNIVDSAGSPNTNSTHSGSGIGSGASEHEWRKSLAVESDPIHKQPRRSSSRDPAGRLPTGGATALPIRNVRQNGHLSNSSTASQNGNHHLSEHLSNADSSSPSSFSSLSANPILPLDNSNESLLRSIHPNRTFNQSLAQKWDSEDNYSASPLRSSIGNPIWSSTNSCRASEMLSSSYNSTEEKQSSFGPSSLTDWLSHPASARRSLSSNGMNVKGTGFMDGTNAAVDRDTGLPQAVQRALSINTASALGHGPMQQTFSPSSLRSSSPEGNLSGVFRASSPRHGLSRLPEGEEAPGEAADGFFNVPPPSGANPFFSNRHPGQRHRSTSSAAALQGIGNDFVDFDRNLARPSLDLYSRSASVWGSGPLSAGLATSPGAYSPFANQHTVTVNSPSFSQLASHGNDRGRTPGTFGADSGLMRDMSNPRSFTGGMPALMNAEPFSMFADDPSRTNGGSDSRRHSMTAAPLIGQRRAIGFEVTRPIPGSRTSSVGRFAGSQVRSNYGMFGGGNLAISDDDLASDFDALRVNLDEMAQQQQRETQQQQQQQQYQSRPQRSATIDASMYSASLPAGYIRDPSDQSAVGEWHAPGRIREEGKSSDLWNRETNQSPSVLHSRRSTVTNTVLDGRAFESKDEVHNSTRSLSARAHSFQIGQPEQSTFNAVPKPMLSDHAIASLVTLGPLAPPSGGPGGQDGQSSNLQDLGKGVPLQMLPRDTPLYIVEFKQGRTDLYFKQSQSSVGGQQDFDDIRKGDLVIVEADRGKDLGSVINDSITVDQVQTFLQQQAELAQLSAAGGQPDGLHPAAMTLSKLTRSVNPKRLFAKAGPSDTSLLHAKAQDEERALTLCTTKVNQRGLPMSVVAAEMQWDRRKLTFYYTATQRVDFRDLVKELFRLYKTRIWMCHLSHPSNPTTGTGGGTTSGTAGSTTN